MPACVPTSAERSEASKRKIARSARSVAGPGLSTKDVVALLGLEGIDYGQIRELYKFIRSQAGTPLEKGDRRWARFSPVDIACMDALIPLCGGVEALAEKRRLRVVPVRRACIWLRAVGFTNPLLEVPMKREGDRVYVWVDGLVVESVSNQMVLNMPESVEVSYVTSADGADDDTRLLVERARQEAQRRGRRAGRVQGRGKAHPVAVRITGLK